jgi:pyridoxal 5'-phosphate synthase pdxT subunit
MRVGLLGLQGAFRDHIPHLRRLGADIQVVRRVEDLSGIDRLILPGGESTVMAKYLSAFGLTAPLQQRIEEGLPIWGVCAGCILLARQVDGRPGVLASVPIQVARNAYGRQKASAIRPIDIPRLDRSAFPAIFIRAPRVEAAADSIRVHARCGPDPVFIQSGSAMATTFHPELTADPAFHEFFLKL